MRSTDEIERDIAFHREQLALLSMELAAAVGEHCEGRTDPTESPLKGMGFFPSMRLTDLTYTFNPPTSK
jgi:hypothetical protein